VSAGRVRPRRAQGVVGRLVNARAEQMSAVLAGVATRALA
jgi:hypothetical protein